MPHSCANSACGSGGLQARPPRGHQRQGAALLSSQRRQRGFDDGAIKFLWSTYSWVKDVKNSIWSGTGTEFTFAFRAELPEFYSHHTSLATTGGGRYAIALNNASADVLIEDGISILANQPIVAIVARAAGAGSVVRYN
jgi:hypothetical protein